ncbi:hypothetical protein K502DRAFT_324644 [Neoconidiobolus thromboides FSU 785]|nr:hypothetical protein K502DRAFT_324644 [Neoconidiobolus thromboides FSU 785]
MSLLNKFNSLSKWVKLSIISSFLQILVICSLEGVIFEFVYRYTSTIPASPSNSEGDSERKQAERNFKALPTYFSLFLFAQFFQFILCVDAALYQNTIQISMLALFNFLLLFYACTQLYQTTSLKENIKMILQQKLDELPSTATIINLEISIIVILVLFATSFAFVAYKLYQEYGWNLYKRIGADLQLKRMFMVYHVFVMILKFDILFFISFSTQYLVLVIYPDKNLSSDFIVHLTVSLAICIVLSSLAFWSVRTESKYGIAAFAVGCIGVLGYFISKLYDIYLKENESERARRFGSSKITLTVFITFCILFSILTVIGSIFCYRNFGRGLKDIINNNHHGKLLPDERANTRSNSRWSLD